MRKIYTLVTILLFSMVTLKTTGQPISGFQKSFSVNLLSTAELPSDEKFSSEEFSSIETVSEINDQTNETCRAGIEVNETPNAPHYKKFTAIPWHSEQKRPVYICWKFGDGTDTCIQYSNTNPGPYSVVHKYQQPGRYEVCVKIVYQDGCEAKECKWVEVEKPDECKADFEKLALATTISANYVTYRALPSHSNDKKPKTICWKFGDGKDTCINYPENYTGSYLVKHHYRENGVYEVCVAITYYGGCTAKKCDKVQIGRPDECKVDFEKNPLTPANHPLDVYFKAETGHSNNKKPKQICWIFGDGKDTCIQYPENYTGPYTVKHQYREAGKYEVCVKVLFYGGCETYKCKPVQIGRPDECKADFERIPISSSDNPSIVGFRALPSHNNNKKPKTICWTFGDGKDTCVEYSQNFSGPYVVHHKYENPGTYTVCVKIIYDGGCEAKKCNSIIVPGPDRCKVDFEKLPLINTTSPTIAYYQLQAGHSNDKKPKTICWTFGDGKDTCIQYPENYTGTYTVKHQYREAGKYEVCAKVIFYGGCEAYQCKSIQIGRPDECKADFEKIPVPGTDNPSAVGFRTLLSHNIYKKPKTICWTFGDGKDTCVEYSQNFSGPYVIWHKYENPGTYTVCVKIIYYGGCEAKKCNSIIVPGHDRCKVDFERLPLVNTTSPLTAYYKLQAGHSNDKKPKTICWTFGDGKDTCIQYPENYTGDYFVKHQYREAGKYEVCAKVLFYGGCEAYQCKTVQIGRLDECKAGFERLPLTADNHQQQVAFKALPSHNNNKKPKTICWTFGDGKDTCIQYPENYNGPYVVKHDYREPGNYEVCIKIFYYGGCEAKKCETIKIEGRGECKVKLFTLTPSINSLVRGFYATTSTSNNKKPVRICWYFGDGTDTCIQVNPSSVWPQLFMRHTYPAPGVYKACVKILFEGGCIAYDCNEVIIKPTTNTCGGYMTDSMVSPRTFKFKGYAVHNPNDPVTGYRWSFGDGSGASGREATHTYNQPGSYEVCLTIKTQSGCETKICKKLNVPGNTQPVLTISPNPVTTVMKLLFYSTHTEPVNIRIVNGLGVIVRNYTRNASTGANNWDFDLSTLTAGSYTLYVQSPNQLSSQIFIKN